MESLKGITQFNTGSTIANGMKLSESAVNSYKASIDGLTLSQAQVALSSTALNDIQKEQILTSAGLLKSTEAITLEEVKQMASSASLSAQKKEEILTTLQGAYSENQWNIEKLEAIAASGGEAGAIAQSILVKKAENAENIKNIAGNKALTASLLGQLKARLALMATNPVVWIAGLVGAGLGLIALEDKLTKSLDECTEELDKLNSEFEQSQSEAESLESEWKTCQTRLSELQKLADNGTISIIEQEEYERLQKTNDELERSLRIEKEKSQLSAIKGATTADETLTKRVQSQYIRGNVEADMGATLKNQQLYVLPEEELDAAIEEYKRLQIEIDNLNKAYDNGEISTSDYEKQLGSLTDQQTKARTRASEMSDILSDCKQAYDNLDNTGGSFTTTQKNNYNAVTEANKRYNEFLGTINGVNETFENLDTTEKAQTLKDRYAKKTLSLPNGQGTYTVEDKEISDWIDTLPDEDLKILGTINFSGEQTKDSMQQALDYAKTHTDTTADETDIQSTITSSIEQISTQLEPQFSKLKDAYQSIFTIEDGKQIFSLDNVDVSMLEDLRKSFTKIEEEIGVAFDASQLKNFFAVLTNGNSTAEEVQNAFNNIATSYLNSTDVLENLNSTTAEAIKIQLESLGVTNSEIIVFEALISNTNALEEAGIDLANATNEELNAFVNEAVSADNLGQALAILQLKKFLVNNTRIDSSDEINQLLTLANAAGIASNALSKLAQFKTDLENETDPKTRQWIIKSINEYTKTLTSEIANVNVEYTPTATPKSASKSGKEAADAYLEAFEKEYKQLKDKLDRGEITEKEYLDNLRALYERYFKDREKYIDEFEKYEQEYLEGMESLYKDVIDGICDLIDKQSDKYDDLRDSAVDSYEAQKEAAEDAYDAQIDAIQAQIDAIDEEIEAKKKQADAIQDEIDKIRKAREERQKKIDLQKKEYELQRMQNQNTKLTYTSEKGFIFTPDTQGIRDAREAVDEAKEELYILQLEKQIDLINDEIDALEERKDALEKQKESIEKMKDASNEYYDSLIKKTEEFYDKLIDTLDKTKSRWQELADLKEEAEMKQKMEEVLNQYGITANDIVNMSEEAFNAFKNDYLNILSDLYSGNEQMQSAIAETAGTTTDKLGSYIASTQEYIDSLNGSAETLQPVVDAIDTTAQSMDNLDTSASNASESTSQIASDMETLNTNSDGVSENIDGISDALDSIPNSTKFDAVATSFEHLGEAIKGVADALGVGTEGTVGGLVTALQEISTLSLDNLSAEGGTGIVSQFEKLKTAVEGVTSAIGGGMRNTGETGTAQNANGGTEGGAQGSSGTLIGALGELKSTADETLGSGGDGENNGEGSDEEGEGVIGKFAQFKSAVDAVTMAIGTGEEEDGYNENGAFTLIGALQAQYDKAAEVIPAEKSLFEELLASIMACVDALVQMSSAIGSLPGIGGGNAYASGTRNAEKGLALVGEEKPEVIVTNDDKVLLAEKPSLINMEGGETVYNGDETEKMLNSNGVKSLHKGQSINTTNAGNAYAKGTDDGTVVMKDGTVLRPLREGDEGYDLIKKAELYFEKFGNQIMPPVNEMNKNMEMMAKNISYVNNNSNMANYSVGDVHIHCPGVTKDEVVKQIGDEMTKTFFGLSNKALQRANITR